MSVSIGKLIEVDLEAQTVTFIINGDFGRWAAGEYTITPFDQGPASEKPMDLETARDRTWP